MFRETFLAVRHTIVIRLCLVLILVLAGCNGLGTNGQSTITPTLSSTDTSTEGITATETEITLETSTATPSNPDNWSEQRKLQFFADSYNKNIPDSEANITNMTVWSNNYTMHVTYTMGNPNNGSKITAEEAQLLITYSDMADFYLNDTSPVSKEWIPKQVNITAIDPKSGNIYYRGQTNYTLMNKYRTGKIEYTGYVFAFYSTLENGPAYSDYN